MMAMIRKQGRRKWAFNTIPQGPWDQGWDVAGPTWVGGVRNGGGIWQTPSIDPDLGLMYFAIGNPYGDSKKRAGTNLFSDCVMALTLETGRIKWFFQEVHHDVWDFDAATAPTLFDAQINGRTVKGLAHGNKSGLLYLLNRETGQPLQSIKEMPVVTTGAGGRTARADSAVPVQRRGKLMEPADIPAIDVAPSQLAKGFKPVPLFVPPGPNQIRPSGGQNYGPAAFSPKLGLLYVNAIDTPSNSGRDPKGAFSAYDPVTAELKWRQKFDGFGQAGPVVTASDIAFVGAGSNTLGYFYAFDAKTGEMLWRFNTGAGVFSSPSIFVVNGEEFVAVASGGGERGRRGGDDILVLGFRSLSRAQQVSAREHPIMRIRSNQIILGAATIMAVWIESLCRAVRPRTSETADGRGRVQERPGAQGPFRGRLRADDARCLRHRFDCVGCHPSAGTDSRFRGRHAEKGDRAKDGKHGDRHQSRQLRRATGRHPLDLPSWSRSTSGDAESDTRYGSRF